jgi:hypothetical protein
MPYGKELRHDFAFPWEIFLCLYIMLCTKNSKNLCEQICVNVGVYVIAVPLCQVLFLAPLTYGILNHCVSKSCSV